MSAIPVPMITWAGCHPQNFARGRGGTLPEALVLHIAAGSFRGIAAWFNTYPHRDSDGRDLGPSSAHFSVAKDGRIQEHVLTKDTAFAQYVDDAREGSHRPGLIDDNLAAGRTPNQWTISIEHEGQPGDVMQEAQLAASTALAAWLWRSVIVPAGASGLALDREHVLMHSDFQPTTRARCPGWGEDFHTRYLARVAALVTAPSPPAPPTPVDPLREALDGLTLAARGLGQAADRLTALADDLALAAQRITDAAAAERAIAAGCMDVVARLSR